MQGGFLLILCGIPCSGKSTLAKMITKKLEDELRINTVIISSDNFRKMVPSYQREFLPELENFVRAATYRTIEEALKWRLFVLSDDLNHYRSIRRQLKRMAERAKADYAIIYIDTPLEVALDWNAKRGAPIPNSLIEEIHYKLDTPGEKYRWDTPLLTINPIKEDSQSTVQKVTEKLGERITQEKLSVHKSEKPRSAPKLKDVDRETRHAMGEFMKRYGNLALAKELSDIRKAVLRETIEKNLSTKTATETFLNRSELLLQRSKYIKKSGQSIIHIGIFGHVDHGKTEIARCLTEKPSTAALDKHPEAQQRGMSIDIGFSAFELDDYLVTLVDLPGHHSLIRHVLGGVNIIDAAILVIAANEGPKTQTIEHLQILKSLEVEQIIVAINKTDLVNEEQLKNTLLKVENLLETTPFKDSTRVNISAIKCLGFEKLKRELSKIAKVPVRPWSGPLKIPISHAFHISGIGTVVTGTILRGKIKVGDTIEILPSRKKGRIKTIQVFSKDVKEASAGDRVGISLAKIRPKEITRGDILITPKSLEETNLLDVELKVEQRFESGLLAKDLVHIGIGLKTIVGRIYPYTSLGDKKILKRKILPGDAVKAIIIASQPIPVEVGEKILLARLDLTHERPRIIGVAKVVTLPARAQIYSARMKKGYVKEETVDGYYIVSGLFKTRDAAEYVSHKRRKLFASLSKSKATILKAHGDNGDIIADFDGTPILSEEIYYYRLRKIHFD